MRETVCGHPGVLFGEGLEVTPMALFAGTFENRIDRKGRVSLPADFRASGEPVQFSGLPGNSGRAPRLPGTSSRFSGLRCILALSLIHI